MGDSAQPDWDFIIAGGGAAGCVLANRLSADPAVRVLLLEAGQSDATAGSLVPAAIGLRHWQQDEELELPVAAGQIAGQSQRDVACRPHAGRG